MNLLFHQHCEDNYSSQRAGKDRVHTIESTVTDCFTETLCCIMLCEGTAEQGELNHLTSSDSANCVSVVSPITFWWLKTFFVLWFQTTAAVTQTVSQMAKEAPAPAARTLRFLMSLPRSRERKLTPTACTRSCGTTTQDRLVCLNRGVLIVQHLLCYKTKSWCSVFYIYLLSF